MFYGQIVFMEQLHLYTKINYILFVFTYNLKFVFLLNTFLNYFYYRTEIFIYLPIAYLLGNLEIRALVKK